MTLCKNSSSTIMALARIHFLSNLSIINVKTGLPNLHMFRIQISNTVSVVSQEESIHIFSRPGHNATMRLTCL